MPPQQVVYVPNGMGIGDVAQRDFSVQREGKERPTLLLYSRLFEFDTTRLITILRAVKTAVPDLRILSVGAGLFAADATQFRQQLAAADLLASVEDQGWVDPSQLPGLLTQADIGLYLMDDTLLNRAKCPVKLADMVALGIPVVGEAVGQVPEYVVNGRSGLLRHSGDNAGLTQDIIDLLQNPAQRLTMSHYAQTHFQANFTWAQQAELLETAYATNEQ